MKPASVRPDPVEVRRSMSCGPDSLFTAWTDRAAVAEWMWPHPSAKIVDLEWDPVVGAPYRIEMEVEGERVSFHGRFLQVDPPAKIAFTWISTRTQGKETRVTVTIRPTPDGSELLLVHEFHPTATAAADHRSGWTMILERLEDHVQTV